MEVRETFRDIHARSRLRQSRCALRHDNPGAVRTAIAAVTFEFTITKVWALRPSDYRRPMLERSLNVERVRRVESSGFKGRTRPSTLMPGKQQACRIVSHQESAFR